MGVLIAVFISIRCVMFQAAGPDPFRVGGLAPTWACVVEVGAVVPAEILETPMLATLAGVIGEIEPRDLVRLRRAVGERWDGPGDTLPGVGSILLRRGRQEARLELLELPNSGIAVRDAEGVVWRLDSTTVENLRVDWWRQGWTPDGATGRTRIAVTPTPATRIEMDPPTVRRVFRAAFPVLSREPGDEVCHIRLPAGHDPARPAGVLVWISPTADGRLPPVYEAVVDQLGLISVGADRAGNDRTVTDRLQLMLDAIETARRRHLVDEERVYVAGFSGGGRCAAVLALAMPDVFAGAVPIGGMDSYHDALAGVGAGYWAARFGKPPAPVLLQLQDRRIAAVIGELDPNHAETRARIELLTEDGVDVRLDAIPGLGHALPDARRFAEALRWVDEPRREALATGAREAARLLALVPAGTPDDPGVRAALIEVVRVGPWSGAAWVAAERLGYSRRGFLTGSR